MAISKTRLNKFTILKLHNKVDSSNIKQFREYVDTECSDYENTSQFTHILSDSLVEEPSMKKSAITFWLIQESKIIISFGDKRSILSEVINLVENVIHERCERMAFSHELLLRLLRSHRLCNDVLGVKLESKETGFIKTISIDGQNLLDTEDFINLLNNGNTLSKIVIQTLDSHYQSFVATIYNSGHIVLSPYAKIEQVCFFINSLVLELEAAISYE